MSIRIRFAALGASALLAVAGPAAAASAAVQDPLPITPNTAFAGLVDGLSADAAIQVGCFGPITPGETGHPLAGQTLEVVTAPVTTSDSGFTGSLGRSIDAFVDLPSTSSSGAVVVFSGFYVKEPLPTTITVPCSGTGTVSFVPEPTSPTARTATVAVSFDSQP